MDALITILLAHPFVILFSLIALGLLLNAAAGIEGLGSVNHPFHLHDPDDVQSRRPLMLAVQRSRQANPPPH